MCKKAILSAVASVMLVAGDVPYQNIEITLPLFSSGPDIIQEDLRFGTVTHEKPYGYDVNELVTTTSPCTILYHIGMHTDGTGWQLGLGGDFRGPDAWMALFAPRFVFEKWYGVNPYLGVFIGTGKDSRPDRSLLSRTASETRIEGSGARMWAGGILLGVHKQMPHGFGIGLAYRLDSRQYTLEVQETDLTGALLGGDVFDSTFRTVEHLLSLSFSYRF